MTSMARLDGYLNDHLGGSTGAIDLAKESRRQNEGAALATYLVTLIAEIEEDRDTLVAVMKRLDIEISQVKHASGWVAEKLSRLKFQLPLGTDERVNRLLELDALLSGIFGKHLLWQMLQRVSAFEPRLAEFDFEALETRAREQIEALDRYRLETFADIFKGS
jgi:hypothetical protein